MAKFFVVVPDGLAVDAEGHTTSQPSFVFRSVLDALLVHVFSDDMVFLAPANSFGGPISEQEAAFRYLEGKTRARLTFFEAERPYYINTRGNAVLLRWFLLETGQWPLKDAILVSYRLHIARSLKVFSQEGFQFKDILPTPFPDRFDEPIVRRLWYYRYPMVHRLYELAALGLFQLKIK